MEEGAVRAQIATPMGLSTGSENSLSGLLRQQRNSLVDDWYDRIADRYFVAAASFLRLQPDRFENPAAYAFRAAIEEIYRALLDDCDVARNPIEYAVKIRAVQEADPSEGVAFVRLIKDIVREKLSPFVSNPELESFYSRVDGITSIAGEMFMANRRKIAELAGLRGSF
jgi:hypothetical protein